MKAANINHLWAKLIVEELIRNGVTRFCISPGSRSTPLTVAVAEHPDAVAVIHTDERGSAFYALGYAKATGKPAALVCTSGTALANYFPAVIEASTSCMPMIILSSDRPVELRDTGANQTIDQVRIFGNYLRWSFDLPSPNENLPASFILTTVDQAFYRSLRTPAGPVQINCQYREPLAPLGEQTDWVSYLSETRRWLETDSAYTSYSISSSRSSEVALDQLSAKLNSVGNGVIIAGGLPCYIKNTAIARLAEQLDWPLITDITSQLRFSEQIPGSVICHYDLYLRSEKVCRKLRPELVLQFGSLPISKWVMQYIECCNADYILVNNHPFRQDPSHRVNQRFEQEPASIAALLADRVSGRESDLRKAFAVADKITSELIGRVDNRSDNLVEFTAVNNVIAATPANRGLYLANSLPVRHADGFACSASTKLHVATNRGASGIEGTIASAVGFANGLNLPTTLIIGDLAFLHDLNSLSLLKNSPIPVTVLLINNNGGGIFSYLPVAQIDEFFEKYFGTPHGLNFKQAAELFSVKYSESKSLTDLDNCYHQAVNQSESVIIEIRTDRSENAIKHQELCEIACNQVEAELS